jgi:hypothetical protein
LEVPVTADSHAGYQPSRPETLDEQLRRKGVRPIQSVHDLARPELFDSDEELDEFLEFTYTARRAEVS